MYTLKFVSSHISMKVVIRNRFGTRNQAAILAALQLATSHRDSSLWNACSSLDLKHGKTSASDRHESK